MTADAEAWVAAGLVLQRGEQVGAELIGLVRPWVEAVVDSVALLPPLGVAADLARLIERAPFDIGRSQPIGDAPLRAALDAYEEHLLGRLSADFRLELARDALVRLPEAKRAAAVGVFVEQVLARVVGALGTPLDSPAPGAVRRALQESSVELFERGLELLGDPDQHDHDDLRDELSSAYASLAAGARRCGALIGDVEIYTLENFEALRSPSLRLAMAQIAEAAQSIEQTLPVRVRRSEASRGRTPTRVEDESAYPIGGYASISNVGGIESLVSSELIYMTPEAERQAGNIDLFDVRWAGDELLKYTRDESVHTRERRTIGFVLDASLVHARIKDPQLPFQRLVVLFGALIAGVRKLSSGLEEADLNLHFLLLGKPGAAAAADAPEQPLRAEAQLAHLLLREFVESGVVVFHELPNLDAAIAHVERVSETGGSEVVWIAEHPMLPELEQGSLVRAHALAIGETRPRLWLEGVERNVNDEGWGAWLRVVQELMATLV